MCSFLERACALQRPTLLKRVTPLPTVSPSPLLQRNTTSRCLHALSMLSSILGTLDTTEAPSREPAETLIPGMLTHPGDPGLKKRTLWVVCTWTCLGSWSRCRCCFHPVCYSFTSLSDQRPGNVTNTSYENYPGIVKLGISLKLDPLSVCSVQS